MSRTPKNAAPKPSRRALRRPAPTKRRLLDVNVTPPMTAKSVDYLRQRLAKPPDGRHDPRSTFGSGLTMERIQSTIYQADWGNPRSLTDLSRETLTIDPHLSAVLTKRIGAVSSLPIEILPAKGPGINVERANFYAEVVRANVVRIPNMAQAVKQLAWAIFDGRAVLEKKWAKAPGAFDEKWGRVTMVIAGLQWIHPRRIFFGPDRELRVVDRPIGIGFSRDGKAFRDYQHKFIEFTPQLFAEYPEREGLARPCLYWSFFKRFAARERMILTELFAKPWRWGEIDSDEDLSPGDRDDLDTIVEQIAGNGYAVLPRGAKLHVESIGQSFGANGSLHKEVIDQADAQISKLVLGQTGTTDSKAQGLGGSQSNVMKDEQEQICVSDATMIQEVLEDFLSDDIIAVNFGAGAITHAPTIKLHADTIDRMKELGRVKAGLDAGLDIALEEAYEVSGFRKPGEDEAVLRIDSPPSKGGGGVGPDGSPIPAPAVTPRAIIAYPAGKVPVSRVQEPAAPVSDGTPPIPEGTPEDAPGAATELPGPLGEDEVIVQTPEETDPSRATDSRGEDPVVEDPLQGEPLGGTTTENDAVVDDPIATVVKDLASANPGDPNPGGGVMTPEDLADLPGPGSAGDPYSPSTGQRGVDDYPDPEKADRVPRGVLSRGAARKAGNVKAVSDAYHVQTQNPLDALTPEPLKDASPTPEPGRSPAAPDVQPPTMVDEALTLPIGPYADFDACVADQKKKGNSDESAHKICGALKAKIEGAVATASRASGGAVNEAGARRIIRTLGEKRAGEVFLAMKIGRLASSAPPALVLVKQPSTVYGSPEPIVKKTVKELAGQTRDWAKKIIDAGATGATPADIFSGVYQAAARVSHDDFGRALMRRIIHCEMLGALDSHFERMTDETVEPAKFSRRKDPNVFDRKTWLHEITLLGPEVVTKVSPTFSDLSYKPATEFFAKKEILPKAAFESLEDGAKARAFTVARMESRELLNLVHAELGRMISEGADLGQFKKFMNDRVVSAGWMPASPSHIETIARTNLAMAHTVGRAVDATQPSVLVDRPYWQIRGVKDDRQRATHGAVDGWVLRADDPFFQQCMPGCFGFNCRCRHTTLSKKQVEKRGLEIRSGAEIKDLPDKGFSGGGLGSLLSAFGAK